jgi:hypothetical protein
MALGDTHALARHTGTPRAVRRGVCAAWSPPSLHGGGPARRRATPDRHSPPDDAGLYPSQARANCTTLKSAALDETVAPTVARHRLQKQECQEPPTYCRGLNRVDIELSL